MKIQKKIGGGGGGVGGGGVWLGGGVRMDVMEELKFLEKFKKKIWGEGSGGLDWGGGVGDVGGG